MIQEMRQLALDFLYIELGGSGDAEVWYEHLRQYQVEALFPYLIEAARDSMASNYYVIYPDKEDDKVAILEQRVFKKDQGDELKLPFVPSTGPNSAAIGPVIKRGYQKGKGTSPSGKVLNTTLEAFNTLGQQATAWASFFQYSFELLARKKLHFQGKTFEGETALHTALEVISENQTAFVSILDSDGKLPGELVEYRDYLQEVLASSKYATSKTPPITDKTDSLSGKISTIYPNALKGAGLNLTSVTRESVFSRLDQANAWKKFSLNVENADLLYIFSFHMRENFISHIAGEKALMLPHLSLKQSIRQKFLKRFKDYVKSVDSGTVARENYLINLYKDSSDAIVNITILWAAFGQNLEDVTGIVADVLPSRLGAISRKIEALKELNSPVFPVNNPEFLEPDLAINNLATLLKRPGGKKNQKVNEGARLFEFKRDIASRIYHGKRISTDRFMNEILLVAKEYLLDIAKDSNTKGFGLLNEGKSEKYLTLVDWIKRVAKQIYFFRELEVYDTMTNWTYKPVQESLKPFFVQAEKTAGLDSKEKVYAFLLGVLFGKVMEVQAARGVNVGANALTWLKRLNKTGADLPNLYNKVREKLLAYETESRAEVNAIVQEIGNLGIQIGTPNLGKTDACYYLLLGQSLTKTLIPSKSKKEE